ncbi:lysophospholipid acyltransferase family protein [Alphaproteobacteria bacterium]|nr:lysophospholipid acyltransferase family protein [Alphaproteobacteria bacterium]
MGITLFKTPVLSPLMRVISHLILRAMGWRCIGAVPPDVKKCIMIVAPHTSNWDFAYFVLAVFDFKLDLRVLIKHTLFVGPLGWFLRYCGAIPVDRRSAGARVRKLSEMMEQSERFVLLITPEGTRSATKNWKTGFYHMAQEANVPIVVTYIDTRTKQIGIDHLIYPSENKDEDIKKIKAFYDTKQGVKPQNYAS